jgi:ribosome biogenesis protein YTM1
MVDLALTAAGNTALAASTDRTVSLYDLRGAASSVSVSAGSLLHPALPACIAPSPVHESHVATGAYDGVVRVWDLRSLKTPVASFKAAQDAKKVLALDWRGGVIAAGGEGGLEVWKFADSDGVPA